MIRKAFSKINRYYYWYIQERFFQDFIFIHINKTGGTSVEKAFGIPLQHKTALEKKKYLGDSKWYSKFSFAFVRNPWDKVVSHYSYRYKTNQTGLADEEIDFNHWVKLAYLKKDTKYYDNPKMFMPQKDWISDESGEILVNFVGRFESFESDFNKICAKLDVSSNLPHLKKSNRSHYKNYYNQESTEIVRNFFRKDIEHFGYKF